MDVYFLGSSLFTVFCYVNASEYFPYDIYPVPSIYGFDNLIRAVSPHCNLVVFGCAIAVLPAFDCYDDIASD